MHRQEQLLAHLAPFHFVTATREAPDVEILAIAAEPSEALARLKALQATGLRVRCRLLIVAGFGDSAPQDLERLVRELAAKTLAAGIAVSDSFGTMLALAERLERSAAELIPSQRLDTALTKALQPRLLLVLNRELLALHGTDSGFYSGFQKAASCNDWRCVWKRFFSRRINYRSDRNEMVVNATDSDTPPPTPEATIDSPSPIDSLSPVKETRYVQQRSYREQDGRLVEERSRYLVGHATTVEVSIGPKHADSIAGPDPFPDDQLPPDASIHRLQVVFHEPQQFDEPMIQEIMLPRQGNSRSATFNFTPRQEGSFNGRLWIVHRGRILQALLLRAQVFSDQSAAAASASSITLDRDIEFAPTGQT